MLEYFKEKTKNRVIEHSHWVTAIDQAIEKYGVKSRQSGLTIGLLSNRLPTSLFIEQASSHLVWSEAIRLSGDDLFGLRLNQIDTPPAIRLQELAVSTSSTVRAALEQLIHFLPILSTQVQLELRHSTDESALLLTPLGEPHPQHIEAVLGYLGRVLNRLSCGDKEILKRVTLKRQPDDAESCRCLLECKEVVYGPSYSLIISHALLNKTLDSADAFICTQLTHTLQDMLANQPSHDLVEQVKRLIQLLLSSGDISVERVAGPLNISSRHLRRKLSQDGTSYEQLMDEVRRETAIRMIGEGELALTNIAYELGFLDPSSFTRAFRRWTNMSPTSFRQQVANRTAG